MNKLIKVLSIAGYYFFPSLRQQDNPATVERGVFRDDPFIHPFLDFFVTGEVCVRKCVLHRPEEMVIIIRRCHVWRVAGCGRTFHSSCRSVRFTLFARCDRTLSCKRTDFASIVSYGWSFLHQLVTHNGIIAVGSDQL